MTSWRLAGSAAAVLGLSLLLAAVGEALHARRTGDPARTRRLLHAGPPLALLGSLLAARSLWAQTVALLAVAAWVGYLFWRWLETRDRPASPPAEHVPSPPPAQPSPPSPRDSALGRWILWGEIAVTVLVAPVLWFPTANQTLVLLAAGLLGLAWIAAALADGEIWPSSPYGPALLLLAAMLVLSAARSSAPDLTLPKAGSLLLGLALYRVALRAARSGGATAAAGGLLALGLGLATIGLIGGARAQKIAEIARWAAFLPRLVARLPETQRGVVNPNQVGGTLLLVAPLALGLAIAPFRVGERLLSAAGTRLAAAVAGGILVGQIVLTQSRSAWAGLLAGLLALLACRWRRGPLVVGLLIVLFVVALAAGGRQDFGSLATAFSEGLSTPIGTLRLDGRLAIWSDTIDRIATSPWLGHPLGTFRLVDRAEGNGIPHAHNVFLQVAYDVGLPGLVAYLALLVAALRAGISAASRVAGIPAGIALGAVCCLLAYHVYGLTDALALGAKPGVLLWALLGLIAGLAEQGPPRPALADRALSPGADAAGQEADQPLSHTAVAACGKISIMYPFHPITEGQYHSGTT